MSRIFLINKEDASPTLTYAAITAEKILKTQKVFEVMLLYNTNDSTIEDVVDEFYNGIYLQSTHLEDSYAYFNPYEPNCISINTELIQLCKDVRKENSGYNRLVFFVSMTILHESSHWKHSNFAGHIKKSEGEPMGEAGECTEMRLLNGILSLSYKSKNDIKLYIKNQVAMFEINSPETVKYTKDLENCLSPQIIKKKTSSSNLTPVVASPNFVTRKLKIGLRIQNDNKRLWSTITITNQNQETVSVPNKFIIGFFHVKIQDPRGSVVGSNRITKLRSLDHFELVDLKQDESHIYNDCLSNKFDLNQSGLYNISMKFSGYNPVQLVEMESEQIHGKFIIQNDSDFEADKTESKFQINVQELPKFLCLRLETNFQKKK